MAESTGVPSDPVSAIAGAAKSLFDVVGGVIKANSQALKDKVFSANSYQAYNEGVQLGHQSILTNAIKEKAAQEQADALMNMAIVIGGVMIILFLMYFLFFRNAG